jgi:CheY-like chemotaxis protein
MVITEMHLPDVTAYEVLRALRGDIATQGLPCIVLSSDAMPAQIERALAAGFDDYWTKPIDAWQLMQNIDDVASDSSLRFHRQKGALVDNCILQARREIRSGATLQSYRPSV